LNNSSSLEDDPWFPRFLQAIVVHD
jgi:hypothetical protein